jgi:hypothetical protein
MELQVIRGETSAEIASSLKKSTAAITTLHSTEKSNDVQTISRGETMVEPQVPLVSKDSTCNVPTQLDEGQLQKTNTQFTVPMEIASPSLTTATQNKGSVLTILGSFLIDWAYTTLIGFLVVSYWRVSCLVVE